MGVDLRVPKIRFATLIEDIPSTAVSQFIVWLDEKVAEFKVNGAMALDSSAEAPRWIRDYSMSVMLSGMSSSQSDNNSEHLPHERTSSSRRKEFPPRPRPQFMRRSPIPSPPVVSKPNRTVSGADISISRAAGEVTPHRQKRARDDGDSALSVVRANSNDLELVEIKKERLDDLVERTPLQVTNIIERGDNVPIQSSRVRSTELVPINSLSQDDSLYGSTTPIRSMKEEPLPDSESGDVVDELPSDSFNTRDSSLRQSRPVSDMLPILSSPHSSTPVISRITPGIDRTSLLASQQSALEMSVESGQADDSFNIMSQEAISLDDSDDNDDSIIKGDAPEDFMTRIMAFESQHTDAGESGDGSMEGVPGTSGVGQSDRTFSLLPVRFRQTTEPVHERRIDLQCVGCAYVAQDFHDLKLHLNSHSIKWRLSQQPVCQSANNIYTYQFLCPICHLAMNKRPFYFTVHLLEHYQQGFMRQSLRDCSAYSATQKYKTYL